MLANKALSSAPSAEPVFVESVFSTYLYTGNGSTQTITNGIDLAGEGGLVWIKNRSLQDFGNTRNHWLFDSSRASGFGLSTNTTAAETSVFAGLIPFNSNGFSINTGDPNLNGTGASPYTYASWTFRKQAKFFDVVTYTGNGVAGRTISHNLGSVPGCVIIKRTDNSEDWYVWHRGLSAGNYIFLNYTNAQTTSGASQIFGNGTTTVDPTSNVFTVGAGVGVNNNNGTYVAYLFAHDAGGFGLDGTDNVISCGSYTGNGSATGPVVTLGWEPQWLLVKSATTSRPWSIIDTMRGFVNSSQSDAVLSPNDSRDESIFSQDFGHPTSTGFSVTSTSINYNDSGQTYIYIAIRRGPMKVPTSGTSVFAPVVYAGNGTSQTITTGFANDMEIIRRRGSAENNVIEDKLRGSRVLFTNTTDSELTSTGDVTGYTNTGFTLGASNQGSTNDGGGPSYISWNFRRAPGFFDVVAYTGTGVGVSQTISHNLAAVPEMMIVKARSNTGFWFVYSSGLGNTKHIFLNDPAGEQQATPTSPWNNTTPSTSSFSVFSSINSNAVTYIAYLFASCPGVSKVGSYTGTGTTKQIDCGFTGGARFVLIKRTDSTGDWYVWDSARGIVAGNDPYLLLNSTAAEVTNTDYIDTYSAGFEISSTAPADINANGGTYIFLAIA